MRHERESFLIVVPFFIASGMVNRCVVNGVGGPDRRIVGPPTKSSFVKLSQLIAYYNRILFKFYLTKCKLS